MGFFVLFALVNSSARYFGTPQTRLQIGLVSELSPEDRSKACFVRSRDLFIYLFIVVNYFLALSIIYLFCGELLYRSTKSSLSSTVG